MHGFRKCAFLVSLLNLSVCTELANCANILSCELCRKEPRLE